MDFLLKNGVQIYISICVLKALYDFKKQKDVYECCFAIWFIGLAGLWIWQPWITPLLLWVFAILLLALAFKGLSNVIETGWEPAKKEYPSTRPWFVLFCFPLFLLTAYLVSEKKQ